MRYFASLTAAASARSTAASAAGDRARNTSQWGAGIATIMPSEVWRIANAREELDTASLPWGFPCTRRHAALMTATALYATTARQNAHTAALGYPKVRISHDSVVVSAKKAVSMVQRFPYTPTRCLARAS